ncbi:MAG: SEC-C metal-binding domain-containing protein [Myxococcota bacterium]
MKRVECVAPVQMDLALELYRKPELVRYLFETVKPPSHFATMALALADSPEPPWVVVAPSGKFLNCLPAGAYPTGSWRVDKRRLDALSLKHERLMAANRYADVVLAEPRTFERLWHGVRYGGHRVRRETIATLLPIANIIASRSIRQLATCLDAVEAALREELPRLVTREGRLRADEEEYLLALWRDLWCIAHMTVLVGAAERETLVTLNGPDALLHDVIEATMGIGLWPLVLRAAWLAARLPGRAALDAVRQRLATEPRTFPRAPGRLLAATFVGVAQKSVARDDARSLLDATARALPGDPDHSPSASRWAALLLPALDDAMDNRGSAIEALARWRPGASDDHHSERVRWANDCGCFWSDERYTGSLPAIMSWAARANPEKFYATEAQRDALLPPWSPDLIFRWLRELPRIFRLRTVAPAKVESKVGRNDPCPCGSQKKLKKCCGA